jgi:glycosyltransferase involved in cell wall biosynthesis
MNNIKVSTITPCYKMKPYLKKFLEELPFQTYFDNLEIVLDHNEPDQEETAWVKEFEVKYPNKIKHIIIEKVDPIGVSMNRCIKEASGDLVTIWNVDDLRTPESIESQVEAIVSNNADIAIGNYIVVRKFGAVNGSVVKHCDINPTEYKRSMIFGPFVMFKKTLCEKAGYFDEQLKSGADFDLSIRLAYNGKVAITKNLLGYYLNEGKGASTRPNSKQPTERTVIELRYGIFDKIDLSFLPRTVEYSIPYIFSFNNSFPVKNFVPNYTTLIQSNENTIHKSIFKTLIKSTTKYNSLKYFLKTKIKKIIHK